MNCYEILSHGGKALAQSRRHDTPMQLLLRLSSKLVEELPKALLAARKTAIDMSQQLAVFPKLGDSASAEMGSA
jgi:hypothetical protein